MEAYKTLQIANVYTENDLSKAFSVLNNAGIEARLDGQSIMLDFDVVDMKYIESQSRVVNGLVSDTFAELLKIRSFSTANGKTVFKSFNKDKKVSNKTENKKKRLGYEYYQKHFSEKNNEIPAEVINKIHCSDSFMFMQKLPDNCIDLIVTSPPYNFGINYNNTNDVNPWEFAVALL
jgi:hypothetical protein